MTNDSAAVAEQRVKERWPDAVAVESGVLWGIKNSIGLPLSYCDFLTPSEAWLNAVSRLAPPQSEPARAEVDWRAIATELYRRGTRLYSYVLYADIPRELGIAWNKARELFEEADDAQR